MYTLSFSVMHYIVIYLVRKVHNKRCVIFCNLRHFRVDVKLSYMKLLPQCTPSNYQRYRMLKLTILQLLIKFT